ncbi:MAG: DUF2470 domain-containing protein [Mariprofundaceae bacterium]
MRKTGQKHANGGNIANIPRPTHGEGIKTLLHAQNIATLCTQSSLHDGYPFGSMMPYALDVTDRPLFLISTMAVHTQNLLKNPKASLYVAETIAEGEPLGTARLSLIGEVSQTEDEGVRDCYLAAHPNAAHWVDFDDFSFYRMQVEHAYFVGGFGVMGWVDRQQYKASTPDPLMHIAARVISHMNDDHADDLICLIQQQQGVENAAEISAARMVGVDRLGFDVKIRIGESLRGMRIPFPTPVDNANEVRTMFISMLRKTPPSV